jgi:Domain of unknown function (DUF6946)
MKRLFIPTQSGSDWQRLLAQPAVHWKVGRSAMTAAASWEEANDALPREISELLDLSLDEDVLKLKLLAAIPEWEVSLPGGKANSHTDILAIARNDRGLCVLAVEAKVDEDFGPTVKDRRTNSSAGQTSRLDYLQSLLGLATLDESIRYQLLHRTASAILTARDFYADTAIMIVQSFGKCQALRDDFDNFCSALNAQILPGGLAVVPSRSRPKLFLGWCSGDPKFLTVTVPGLG